MSSSFYNHHIERASKGLERVAQKRRPVFVCPTLKAAKRSPSAYATTARCHAIVAPECVGKWRRKETPDRAPIPPGSLWPCRQLRWWGSTLASWVALKTFLPPHPDTLAIKVCAKYLCTEVLDHVDKRDHLYRRDSAQHVQTANITQQLTQCVCLGNMIGIREVTDKNRFDSSTFF